MAERPDDDAVVTAVAARVNAELGARSGWAAWPGGWPGDIESALIDAVFSARAVYKSARGRGVHDQVCTWQASRPAGGSSLERLRDEIEAAGVPEWAIHFKNSQHSPGRSPSAPEGSLKAAAVLEGAQRLITAGVSVADDITDETSGAAKAALKSVSGIGYATSNYFFMLLGRSGVKPDRMVHRFIADSIGGNTLSNQDADRVITSAAAEMGVPAHELEHAIWKWESDRARS